MTPVRFLAGAKVGHRFYSPGLAAVPDKSVPDLLARGVVVLVEPPPPGPSSDQPASAAVSDRVTKPAPSGMSKSALKRLLRMGKV